MPGASKYLDKVGIDVVCFWVSLDDYPRVVVGFDISPPVEPPVLRHLSRAGRVALVHLRTVTQNADLLGRRREINILAFENQHVTIPDIKGKTYKEFLRLSNLLPISTNDLAIS